MMPEQYTHQDFILYKRHHKLTNAKIAEIIGSTPNAVKNMTQPNKPLPKWAVLAIWTWRAIEYKCLEDYVMYDGRTAFIQGKEYSFVENIGKSEIHDIHDMQDETEFYRYFKQIPEPNQPIQSPDADNTERGEVEDLAKSIDESGLKVTFGLQPKHLEVISETLKKWNTPIDIDGKSETPNMLYSQHFWNDCAKQIGWCPFTLSLYYFNWVQSQQPVHPTPPTLLNELRENEMLAEAQNILHAVSIITSNQGWGNSLSGKKTLHTEILDFLSKYEQSKK